MTPELQRVIDQQLVVQFHNITKNFGSTLGPDNVKLDIRTGEITVLLGLSGSGKTTLLHHIGALHAPSSDTVCALGQDLNALKKRELRELREDVDVIFQNFNLIGRMSVLENVCTGALGSLKGSCISLPSYPKRVKQEAPGVLDRVDLADRAHQRADTFSSGQQQRAAIMRALMQHLKILLADEPIAAPGPVSSNRVIKLLEQISCGDNLTAISSLYQVQLAMDFVGRIISLQVGRVKFDHETRGMTAGTAATIYQSVFETTEDAITSASLKVKA